MTNIYQSEYAQLSQPLGKGNWGKKRFELLKGKLDFIFSYKKKQILELQEKNEERIKLMRLETSRAILQYFIPYYKKLNY